jgi:hypothetical protein
VPNATVNARSRPQQAGAANQQPSRNAAPMLPFGIAARNASRFSFNVPATTLTAGSIPLSPIQIPAVGYLKKIVLDVTISGSGGTTPAFTADAPFNVLQLVELRNSSGNDLIVPLDGYRIMLANKYGCQGIDTPYGDPRADDTYTAVSPSAHFMLDVPCEVSPADQFGAIPALASNRSYQLALTLNPQSIVTTSNPTLIITINGYAVYWTEPVSTTQSGVGQQSTPPFNGSLNLWQFEPLPVTPGDKYLRSNNVGNVLRTLIFCLRNAAGAREDTDWPAVCELFLDNVPMFYLPRAYWLSWMSRVYGFQNAPGARDAKYTLDTGVYVLPFFAMQEGQALANARRGQYLPTLDASLLQLRGTSWGATASTLEIITNSVQPVNPANGQPSTALYNIS